MKLSTKLMLAMVALVLLTATIIGLLTYRNIEALVVPRALAGIEARARLLALDLESSVRSARADVIGFRSAVAVAGIVRASRAGGTDPENGVRLSQWRDRLAARFAVELGAKPNYAHFRIIGLNDAGREILRVDRSGPDGAIRIVPDAELERRGDRDFFQRAMQLPEGEIDVSPVELSHDAAGQPRIPVIRATAAIHGPDGRPFGALVIVVDLRAAFARLRAGEDAGKVYLFNDQGDYLVHPDPANEFGFLTGNRTRVQDEFPDLLNEPDLTDIEPRFIRHRSGEIFGAAAVSVQLAQGPVVTLFHALPYSRVLAPAITARNSILVAGLAAVFAALLLAVALARSLTRPLVAMTRAVEAFGRGEPIASPAQATGEIGTLSRAFARIASDMQEKTAALAKEITERRQLFDTSPDLLLVVDRAGSYIEVNPSSHAILGYRPDEMIGRNGAEFVCPDDLDQTRGEMRKSRHGQLMRNFESRYVHKDGHLVALQWTGVWSEPAQRHFFIGRDLTEKIAYETQLHQAQKMDAMGQLTGGVAHDFNNILTVIMGTAEIVGEEVSDRPGVAAKVKLIDEAAMRGAALTQQLLAFARRQALQPMVLDLNVLVTETASLLHATLGEQIEIEAMLDDGIWQAVADRAQLTTALVNLAVNARDAMPNGGKLTIETSNVILDETYALAHAEVRPGDYVMIAVSDTGGGIPAALLEKVFEPFFTTKGIGKGTGLGLSMVFGFVKQSGGHIKVYSEEGHGTVMKIYLPRADVGEVVQETVPIVPAPGGHETILVVEDDPSVRDYVVAQLTALGYTTLAAESAGGALAIVKRGEQFDLLFTDVIMPGGMNGRQLADAVVRLRPGNKVLYTSGYTEDAIVHHGRLDPGVDLLNKPYRRMDLATKLRLVLDRED